MHSPLLIVLASAFCSFYLPHIFGLLVLNIIYSELYISTGKLSSFSQEQGCGVRGY